MSSDIPKQLSIEVLYADGSVLVINKPCHLRSVPGHANPPSTSNKAASTGKRKRNDGNAKSSAAQVDEVQQPPTSNRQTAQEAWVEAIQSFEREESGEQNDDVTYDDTGGSDIPNDDNDKAVAKFLQKLSSFTKNGIPRKKKLFLRYANRNRQRLFGGDVSSQKTIDKIAAAAFEGIKERQVPLLNLPEQTIDEESVHGQLKLLGYEDLRKRLNCTEKSEEDNAVDKQLHNDASHQQTRSKIRVVHRLDCETSGIMVFARTKEAASKLCEAWRNRDGVKKFYLARVKRWPPYQQDGEEIGTIDLPLAPSEERLKWKVVNEGCGGKPSQTLWSLYKSQEKEDEQEKEEKQEQSKSDDDTNASITLELQPVTGRTHQLRIHCAAVGSGIEGDTLYGDDPIEWDGLAESASHTLCLHAHKLCFPHPKTGKQMEFASKPEWLLV